MSAVNELEWTVPLSWANPHRCENEERLRYINRFRARHPHTWEARLRWRELLHEVGMSLMEALK